jgi:hypothetical protein
MFEIILFKTNDNSNNLNIYFNITVVILKTKIYFNILKNVTIENIILFSFVP